MLKMGYHEQNPFLESLFKLSNGFDIFILIKLIVFIVILLLFYYILIKIDKLDCCVTTKKILSLPIHLTTFILMCAGIVVTLNNLLLMISGMNIIDLAFVVIRTV